MRLLCALLGALAVLPSQAASWSELVEQAWQRLPQAPSSTTRQQEVQARTEAAEALFPGPPTLSLGYRSDQAYRNRGERDYEAELAVPLWLPGERSANRQLARAEGTLWGSTQQLLRWQLAGALREAVWDRQAAEARLHGAESRLKAARQIETDVKRRIQAGDLARVDGLLAQAETAAAELALSEAQQQASSARAAYRRLTGDDRLPDQPAERLASVPDLSGHPQLLAWQEQVAVGRARTQLLAHSGRPNPELALGVRRERGSFQERTSQTIGVQLKIPLGANRQRDTEWAAAHASALEAESQEQRGRFDLELTLDQARQALTLHTRQTEVAEQRARALSEHAALVQRGFRLGETSLLDYQRSDAALREARLQHRLAQLAEERARARVNQAQGIMP